MQKTCLKHQILCPHLWEKTHTRTLFILPRLFNWPGSPKGAREYLLREIVSSASAGSLELCEARPASQGWAVISNDCTLCPPRLGVWDLEGQGREWRAKGLRHGLWVRQNCWLSANTKSVFCKHNCFTAFSIFFVVFFLILPLCFLWWCFFK